MNLLRLSYASFLLIAAAAVFTIAFGNEQSAKSDMPSGQPMKEIRFAAAFHC